MLRNPDFQLLLSFTYIGGRTMSASILINNRRSKWKWDKIFEFKEILNRVTGLENNSSIDLRIKMFDNRLKPAFYPKRLNTKKGNFQKNITFWFSYDRRFAIIQRTKRFSKHPIQYRQSKLMNFSTLNLWMEYINIINLSISCYYSIITAFVSGVHIASWRVLIQIMYIIGFYK